MAKAYIGLGSNIGDRKNYLEQAARIFVSYKDIEVTAVSSVYQSKPEGYTKQRNFYNAVVELETCLLPLELLQICQEVEKKLGREKTVKWGPRTIDADILLYDNQQINFDELIVPHPRLLSRGFMLVPLLEIAPNAMLPSGKPLKTFLANLPPASYPERVGGIKI